MRNGMGSELTGSQEILGQGRFPRVSYQVKMDIQYSSAALDSQLIIREAPH